MKKYVCRGMKTIGLSAISMLLFSPVFADQACHDEAAAIQTVMDPPPTGISQTDLDEAYLQLNQLMMECESGAALADVQGLVDSLRTLLGMGP